MFMHVKWFGEAWGHGGAAGVCSEREHWIAAPGVRCMRCHERIERVDRGIAMAISIGEDDTQQFIQDYTFGAVEDGYVVRACAYHLDCHLAEIGFADLVSTAIMAEFERVGPITKETGWVPEPEVRVVH